MPSNTSLELELRISALPVVFCALYILAHGCVSENSRGHTYVRFVICYTAKSETGAVAATVVEPVPKLFLRAASFAPGAPTRTGVVRSSQENGFPESEEDSHWKFYLPYLFASPV